MNSTRRLARRPTEWLLDSPLAPYVEAFTHYFTERGYASRTIANNLGCVSHFARWMGQCQMDIHRIDEDVVRQFLDEHLPQCDCVGPGCRTRPEFRAALRHLLVVLRAESVIAELRPGMTPVDEELRRFDEHMDHVRGLAPKTRSMRLRTVRRLLVEQFGDGPVVLSAMTPDDVRRFVACQIELYSTPGSAGTLSADARTYFTRPICGPSEDNPPRTVQKAESTAFSRESGPPKWVLAGRQATG